MIVIIIGLRFVVCVVYEFSTEKYNAILLYFFRKDLVDSKRCLTRGMISSIPIDKVK
jgi:hypothetical protein